jgi:predicted TIM-barrel fold metal-dependent hydrolase
MVVDLPDVPAQVRETWMSRLVLPRWTHTHVFVDGYPLSPERGYDTPESNPDHMMAMHAALGIERVVLTQPSAYGSDNSAILDTVAHMPDCARAVVAVRYDMGDRALVELVEVGNTWVKLSAPNRLGGGDLSPWPDAIPLAREIAANPERMPWGSEWPHPNKFTAQSDDADLFEPLELWASDEEIRIRILVTNPERLYGLC